MMYLLTPPAQIRHIWPKWALFALFRHMWGPQMWRFEAILGLFRHILGFRGYPVSSYGMIIKQMF
jgi:hypothetical protein